MSTLSLSAATPADRHLSRSERLLAPFRRITSSGVFIPEVDGLRFIAIFFVYIYHLAGDVLRHSSEEYVNGLDHNLFFALTQQLKIGVPMFFVISGFILGLPFARAYRGLGPSVSLKKYLWRRITRLEPPYIISIVLFFGLKIIGTRGTPWELAPHLWASLAYVHNLVFAEPSLISVVAWSLEVEVQFYVLAPLFALLFACNDLWTRRTIMVSTIALASWIAWRFTGLPLIHLSLIGNAQYFIGGLLLADLYLVDGCRITSPVSWDVLSVSGWVVFLSLLVWEPAVVSMVAGLGLPLLYFASMQSPIVRRVLRNTWLVTIGGMCYSLYLLHNYAIALCGFSTERIGAVLPFSARFLVQFLLITPAVLIVSALYYRLIERPCMNPNWPVRLKCWFRTSGATRQQASLLQKS